MHRRAAISARWRGGLPWPRLQCQGSAHLDVSVKVLPAEHAEALAAAGEQDEEAAAAVVVLAVRLRVPREVLDAPSQQADAHRHRAGVVLERLQLADELVLLPLVRLRGAEVVLRRVRRSAVDSYIPLVLHASSQRGGGCITGGNAVRCGTARAAGGPGFASPGATSPLIGQHATVRAWAGEQLAFSGWSRHGDGICCAGLDADGSRRFCCLANSDDAWVVLPL